MTEYRTKLKYLSGHKIPAGSNGKLICRCCHKKIPKQKKPYQSDSAYTKFGVLYGKPKSATVYCEWVCYCNECTNKITRMLEDLYRAASAEPQPAIIQQALCQNVKDNASA